nr:reverse transcriptase [Tanacetum cinerariifolium]
MAPNTQSLANDAGAASGAPVVDENVRKAIHDIVDVRFTRMQESIKALTRMMATQGVMREELLREMHAMDRHHLTLESQITFESLKKSMISASVLALPDFDKEFTVEVDASEVGIGVVLIQGDALSRIHNEAQLLSLFTSSLVTTELLKRIKATWEEDTEFKAKVDKVKKKEPVRNFYVLETQQLRRKGRDKVFICTFWKELFKLLHVKLLMSTAYHPQTNAQIEVVNRGLECYLRCMCGENPKDWNKWFSLAEWWYNTNYHSVLKTTPYEVLYGQKPHSYSLYALSRIHNEAQLLSLFTSSLVTTELLKRIKATWEEDTEFKAKVDKVKKKEPVRNFYVLETQQLRRKGRDKVFICTFWKELFKLLHVKLLMSTAYHPQTNAQIEVVNRGLECYLRCMCGENPKDWNKWFSLAEWWVDIVDRTLTAREEVIKALTFHLKRA